MSEDHPTPEAVPMEDLPAVSAEPSTAETKSAPMVKAGGGRRIWGYVKNSLPWIVILGIAGFLRFYKLDDIPAGIWDDEAAIGATAYKIGHTGRDYTGKLLPIFPMLDPLFKLPGIVSQPIFVYSSIPFVTILGPSIFSIRFSAVTWGFLNLLGAWWFGREVLGRRGAFLAAFFIAVSPWQVLFSRTAFEAISMPFFLGAGGALLVRAMSRNSNRLLAAGFAVLAAGTYTYPATKLFVPLLTMIFFLAYGRQVLRLWRGLLCGIILAVIIGIPNIRSTFWGDSFLRTKDTSLLYNTVYLDGERSLIELQAYKIAHPEKTYPNWFLATAARKRAYAILNNYKLYLSPRFLTKEGELQVSRWGVLLPISLLLMIIGAEFVIGHWRDPRFRFLLFWILIYPLPASLTMGSPHALRSMVFTPALEVLMACAFISFGRMMPNRSIGSLFTSRGGRLLLILSGFVAWRGFKEGRAYYDEFFNRFPIYAGCSSQESYIGAMRFVNEHRAEYDRVVVWQGIDLGAKTVIGAELNLKGEDYKKPQLEQLSRFNWHFTQNPQEEVLGPRDLMIISDYLHPRLPNTEVIYQAECMPKLFPVFVVRAIKPNTRAGGAPAAPPVEPTPVPVEATPMPVKVTPTPMEAPAATSVPGEAAPALSQDAPTSATSMVPPQ